MSVVTAALAQEKISGLPKTKKRELAIWLLNQFDSNAILELLRDVSPASEPVYDYEAPGPLTDEAALTAAEECFLTYDREEAAVENARAQ